MENLNEIRLEINKTDKEMAALFEKRMSLAKQVAEYKIQNSMPIFDAKREAQVVEKNLAYIESDEMKDYYTLFIKDVMDISKKYQEKLIKGLKVAYCGVEGAFAHIAAERIFENSNKVSYESFDEAYKSVESGENDCAILPVENSYAGEVGANIDLIFSGSLYVNGIYNLLIKQNLMAKPGTKLEDIKEVISHPQALQQCAKYIEEKGFEAKNYKNTAIAAQYVANSDRNDIAAIASLETAKLYGLEMLEKNINESSLNTTKFAVVSRTLNKNLLEHKHSNFILMFSVKHESGALAKAISVIGKYGFNMNAIKSRSLKTLSWQYYFYTELEGDILSENGKNMLEELKNYCDKLKVVGGFENNCELKAKED